MINSTSKKRERAWVAEALKLHHEACEKEREAEKYWNKVGVTTCNTSYGFGPYIHVFSGINKLSELFDRPLLHEDNCGKPDPSRAVVTLPSGERCFSIGDPITPVATEYVFK